jgi:hypothetical protein
VAYSLLPSQKSDRFPTSMQLAAAVVVMIIAVLVVLDHVDSPYRDRSAFTIVLLQQLL